MKKLAKTILVLLFPASLLAQDINFYVSPFSKQNGNGSLKKPFNSIENAQLAVRKAKKTNPDNISVLLLGGTYILKEPVLFTPADGGNDKTNVIYKNYNDEKVIISGGKKLTNWEYHKDGIYKARIEIAGLRNLYVNGEPAIRARTPNTSEYLRLSMWDIENKLICLNNKELPSFSSLDPVEIVIQMSWAGAICRIDEIMNNEQGGYSPGASALLKLKEPERELIFSRDYPPKTPNQACHLENSYDFLDAPGEFYFDKEAKELFYKPRINENMNTAEAVVPVLENLVTIRGTNEEPVKNLSIKGLTFAHTKWDYADTHGCLILEYGQYTIQPTKDNIQFVGRQPSMLVVENANHIRIERNVFRNAGATGLDFHYGTSHSNIIGNKFLYIAGNGICYAKFSDPEVEMHVPYNPENVNEISTDDSITNNYLCYVGEVYYGSGGIVCGYPRNLLIAHNELTKMPGVGIAVGWGWTKERNVMSNNKIVNNEIHKVVQLIEDQGAIKLLSNQPGSEVSGNYIYDIVKSEWSLRDICPQIYFDEGTSGVLVKNNAVSKPVYESFKFHRCGRIVLEDCCQGYRKDIQENAGLRDDYKDIRY